MLKASNQEASLENSMTATDNATGTAIDTATDTAGTVNEMGDTAMTSEGFGMTTGRISDHVADGTLASGRSNFGSDVSGFKFDGIRERGLELATSLNQQTRANPWLAVGLVGVGALALGYIFGRRMPAHTVAPQVRGIARESDRYEKFSGYAD
ncbi:MAG: hypothetical protein EOP05_08145 [Proteobacteria bacterium]|nr:MAG: hypothetical protein EOP05_08145 [Pseudomonadota bacterium]